MFKVLTKRLQKIKNRNLKNVNCCLCSLATTRMMVPDRVEEKLKHDGEAAATMSRQHSSVPWPNFAASELSTGHSRLIVLRDMKNRVFGIIFKKPYEFIRFLSFCWVQLDASTIRNEQN